MNPDTAPPDYQRLFEQAPGAYLVLTPELRIVAASDAYLRSTMRRREDVVGRLAEEAFPPNPHADASALEAMRRSIAKVVRERSPDVLGLQRYDILRPPEEGGGYVERYWIPVNSPVLDESGEVSHVIHRVEDATEFVRLKQLDGSRLPEGAQPLTRQMELELFQRARELESVNKQLLDARAELENQLFRSLFDFMPQLGWTARPDGYIDFYNKGWYEYTGTTFDEMQGWGWEKVHDPAMLPLVVERWQHSIATGTPFEMQFPLRGRDGVFRWFLTRVNPMRDADGTLVRWVGINTNVDSERRASSVLEERVRERTRELEALNDELQRLAKVVSHEMQEPIATTTSYLRLLAVRYQDRLGEDANEFIEKCTQAGRKLERMIDDLWTYARISSWQDEPAPVRLSLALDKARDQMRAAIAASGAAIESEALPAVIGHEKLLVMLFKNMIDNAILRAGPAPARLAITAASAAGSATITFRDEGESVDPVHLTDIFKLYSKAGRARSPDATGMGLAICRKIAELHGGEIRARAPAEGGLAFDVTFPQIPDAPSVRGPMR